MIREIKFKAITKNKKELWEGYYIYSGYENKHFIVQNAIDNNEPNGSISFAHFVEVEKETISQFTGILDGNKCDIYENDFVKFRPNYTNKPVGEQIGLVVFYDNQWTLQVNEYYYSISEETDEFYCYSEIVGNLFRNPDILNQPI